MSFSNSVWIIHGYSRGRRRLNRASLSVVASVCKSREFQSNSGNQRTKIRARVSCVITDRSGHSRQSIGLKQVATRVNLIHLINRPVCHSNCASALGRSESKTRSPVFAGIQNLLASDVTENR